MRFNTSHIAKAMFSQPVAGTSIIDAAYTYFGQFIAHELSPSTGNRMVSRAVTGRLELDSLYGCTFDEMASSMPQSQLQPSGLFRLSEDEWPARPGDVFRKTSTDDFSQQASHQHTPALIAEMRNDANLIVCQLHRAFLRVHNKLVSEQWVTDAIEARQVLTLLLQLVVVEDYLAKLLSPEVYQFYFQQQQRLIGSDYARPADYFNLASFRFGHSMVRQTYTLNQQFHSRIKLADLMQINCPIASHHIIDWQHALFSSPDINIQDNGHKALKIDTHLSFGMAKVEAGELQKSIVEFNLQAAQEKGLAAGIDWFNKLYKQSAQSSQLFSQLNIEPLSNLAQASFEHVEHLHISNLPLWLYVLLEAQVQQNGHRLGGLASMLNAEVLYNAMQQARCSIYDNTHFDTAQVIKRFPEPLKKVDWISNAQFTLQNLLTFASDQ